jgi:hypothetical protein
VFISVSLGAECQHDVSDPGDDDNARLIQRLAPFRTQHLVVNWSNNCDATLLACITQLPHAANHLRVFDLYVNELPLDIHGGRSLVPLRVLRQLETFRYRNWGRGNNRGVPLCDASLATLCGLTALQNLQLQVASLRACAGLPTQLLTLVIDIIRDTTRPHDTRVWGGWFARLTSMTKLTRLVLGPDDDEKVTDRRRYNLEAIARASPHLVELSIRGECLPPQKLPLGGFACLKTLTCTIVGADTVARTTFAIVPCQLLLSLPKLETLNLEAEDVDTRGQYSDRATAQLAHVIGVTHRAPKVIVSTSLTNLNLLTLHDATLKLLCSTSLPLRHLTIRSAYRVTTLMPLTSLAPRLESLCVWSCKHIDQRMTARYNRTDAVRLRAWPNLPALLVLEIRGLTESNLALVKTRYTHANTFKCEARRVFLL